MQQAAPVGLIAVAISAGVGALDGLRHGLVRYKAAALIALSGFPFVYLGQIIAHQLSQPLLEGSFACMMLLVAYRLYRQCPSQLPTVSVLDKPMAMVKVNRNSGKFIWSIQTAAWLAFIGGATGLMTGILGVGGGFLIVPMLRKLTDLSVQAIVATSLMVVALVSVSGVGSAVMRSTTIPWGAASLFTAATVIGMLAGRKLIQKISPSHVQAGFAFLLILVALGLCVKAFMALR
jgi:uncharacterized membrane protein YfcA